MNECSHCTGTPIFFFRLFFRENNSTPTFSLFFFSYYYSECFELPIFLVLKIEGMLRYFCFNIHMLFTFVQRRITIKKKGRKRSELTSYIEFVLFKDCKLPTLFQEGSCPWQISELGVDELIKEMLFAEQIVRQSWLMRLANETDQYLLIKVDTIKNITTCY